MSTRGPGLFTDIGSRAKELLTRDYYSDQKFALLSNTDTGIKLNSTIVKKGGLFSGNLTFQYQLKNMTLNSHIDTESNVMATVTVSDLLPSTKAIASVNLPDYNTGKLEVQCLNDLMSFSTAAGLDKSPALEVSATIGTSSFAIGAEASYLISTGTFAKYNAGVNLTQPTSNTSLLLSDKGDSIIFSYMHHLGHLNGGAVVGEISRKLSTNGTTLTVGCLHVVDPYTVVKAKLNNHGNLAALVKHEIMPKSFLTISGAFDTKALDNIPKFGLALSLNP